MVWQSPIPHLGTQGGTTQHGKGMNERNYPRFIWEWKTPAWQVSGKALQAAGSLARLFLFYSQHQVSASEARGPQDYLSAGTHAE